MPLSGAGVDVDAFGTGYGNGVKLPSLKTRNMSLPLRTTIPSHELNMDKDDDSEIEDPYDNDWLRKSVVKSPVVDPRKPKSGDKDQELLDMMNRNMLLRILHDPAGLHKFTDFVRNNGSVELIFFYLNCELLDIELSSVKKAVENVYDLQLVRNAPLHVALPGRSRTQAVHTAKEFLTLQNPYNTEKERAFETLYKDHLSAFLKYRLTMLQQKRLRDNSLLAQSALLNEGAYTSHGATITGLGDCFCLSDATPGLDTPVIMASDGFVAVSGYTRQECLDRNCRFLQGPQTSPDAIARFRKGVQESREVAELLLNYKKDGTPFWNLCLVSPLKNDHGQTRYFLGCQINVTPTLANENDLDFLLSDEQSTTETIETTPAIPTETKKTSFMKLLAKQLKLRKERPQKIEGPTTGLTAGSRLQGTSVVGAEAHLLNVHTSLEDQVGMLHAAYSRFFLIDPTSPVILYRSVQFSSYIQEQWNSASDCLLAAAQVLKRGTHFPGVFARYNPKPMAQSLSKALSNGNNISISNVVFEDARKLTKHSSPNLNGMSTQTDVMMHVTSLKNRNGDIGGWIIVLC